MKKVNLGEQHALPSSPKEDQAPQSKRLTPSRHDFKKDTIQIHLPEIFYYHDIHWETKGDKGKGGTV